MTTLDDVADVETVDRPATKSPDTRAAVNYLIASGATAISIIETETGCSFRVGHKIDPRAVEICWLTAAQAKPLVRLARKQAGRHPNVATASAALAQAAAALRATLTPHDVALSRAGNAAAKLDACIESLRVRGAMREFTKAYRRRRLAAAARGEGFMSFKVAELRLRRSLIPLLLNGGQPAIGQSLFAEIFGADRRGPPVDNASERGLRE
jgi:hypothetical protein